MTTTRGFNHITKDVLTDQLIRLVPARRIILKFMLQGKGILDLDNPEFHTIDSREVCKYYSDVFSITEQEAKNMLCISVLDTASHKAHYSFTDDYGDVSGLWIDAYSREPDHSIYHLRLSRRIADAFNKIGVTERTKLLDELTQPAHLGINPRASRLLKLITDNVGKDNKYEVGYSELRDLLGIDDTYLDIQNFKKFVLHKAIEDIKLAIGTEGFELPYTDITEGRKIVGFIFDAEKLRKLNQRSRDRLTYAGALLGINGTTFEMANT